MSADGEAAVGPRHRPWMLGHEAALATLERARLSGRLAHAWLLTGPRGVGKATLAYRFARSYLAGPDHGEAVHDESHPVFRKVRSGSHEDLTTIEPRQAKRGAVAQKVDHVREVLGGLYRTSLSGRKVCLIDDADVTLSAADENALLKILEEPPAGLVFLLVAQRPGGVLPTIASRCARLRLTPLADDLVALGLRRLRPELAESAAHEIAALAGGSIGRALELETLDWAGSYASLLRAVAMDGGGEAGDLAASAVLAKTIEAETHRGAGQLLAVILRRAVAAGCDRPPRHALFADEPACLDSLARRAAPAHLLDLASDLAVVAGRVEGLNLDPLQALVQIVHGIRHPEAPRMASLA